MLQFALSTLAALRVFFQDRSDTALELLALRQQVAVLKRKRPRPRLNSLDRLIWTALRFVIEPGRRRILHFNITRHPNAEWVVQQLREAFPEAGPYRYVILDQVIAPDERHLLRLVRDYVSYYHRDRIHDSLDKDTPDRRPVERKSVPGAEVIALPRLAGLHHRYAWCRAA